ncbi:MAG TPA: hypothetical protein VNA20_16250 [Frankiaceae bacterium]|nr:hypothetical protein [Frankiaceae bacterium]
MFLREQPLATAATNTATSPRKTKASGFWFRKKSSFSQAECGIVVLHAANATVGPFGLHLRDGDAIKGDDITRDPLRQLTQQFDGLLSTGPRFHPQSAVTGAVAMLQTLTVSLRLVLRSVRQLRRHAQTPS